MSGGGMGGLLLAQPQSQTIENTNDPFVFCAMVSGGWPWVMLREGAQALDGWVGG
jgi:hypothetical protein